MSALLPADASTWPMPSWLQKALQDSPYLAFAFAIFWICFKAVQKQHERHLADKDKEIERLVKERDRLQSSVLKNRRTTEEGPGPTPQAQPQQPPKKRPKDKK